MKTRVVSRLADILGRQRRKISEVSRATGISRTTLTNLYYEKGGAVSFDVLNRLCEFLECDIGDILQISKVQ